MDMRRLSNIVCICDFDDGARARISFWWAVAVGAGQWTRLEQQGRQCRGRVTCGRGYFASVGFTMNTTMLSAH